MIGLVMAVAMDTAEPNYAVAGGCTTWTAQVVAQYPTRQTVTFGHLDYFCDIAQGCDDGFTHFIVSGVPYNVQHPNVHQAQFMANCTVLIVYNADPIFWNGFGG